MSNRCPEGFEKEGEVCRRECPSDFKYTDNSCVFKKNNSLVVYLVNLPLGMSDSDYTQEATRVNNEIEAIRAGRPLNTGRAGVDSGGSYDDCPRTFKKEGNVCRRECPSDFKYVGNTCVYKTDNSRVVTLKDLPVATTGPPGYMEEAIRVDNEIEAIRSGTRAPTTTTEPSGNDRTGSTPAPFSSTADMIKSVSDSLTPHRPPTAPASDIEQERRAILQSSAPSMLLIHVSLFAVVLCLLAYAFVPVEYAHWISLVVLSMAVAVGIFLWK
jgi:hypothetical protein